MISAETEAPLTTGWPTFGVSPPTRSTSSNVTLSPALPLSFSTRTFCPSETLYCLPPVLMTAYILVPFLLGNDARPERVRTQGSGSIRKRRLLARLPTASFGCVYQLPCEP